VIVAAVVAVAASAARDRDTGFGNGGTVTTVLRLFPSGASALVLQPDGKLVAAGSGINGRNNHDLSEFELARYDKNGRLDRSFGNGGTLTGIGNRASAQEYHALVLQPDGKLVAAADEYSGLELVRYDKNGRLDRSFGNGGTTPAIRDFEAWALVLQPDGKLVAAGVVGRGDHDWFALTRYDANGRLDRSFGNGGTVTTAIGKDSGASALVLQPDGKLVAAGAGGPGESAIVVARYEANGRLDRSFGKRGAVTTAIGKNSYATALVLQPDGKLVAAGSGHYNNGAYARFALARYDKNGRLDRSFGRGGTITTAIGKHQSLASALVLQPDGKLVAAGEAPLGSHARFALARYDANGRLDRSFGNGGTVTTAIGRAPAEARALVLQPDGKLVAAGGPVHEASDRPGSLSAFYGVSIEDGFALARYDKNGGLDK
jgi:uncharacterized delta-60 repeat protein